MGITGKKRKISDISINGGTEDDFVDKVSNEIISGQKSFTNGIITNNVTSETGDVLVLEGKKSGGSVRLIGDPSDTTCPVVIANKTNPNLQLCLGYDTVNNRGSIAAIEQGVGFRPLHFSVPSLTGPSFDSSGFLKSASYLQAASYIETNSSDIANQFIIQPGDTGNPIRLGAFTPLNNGTQLVLPDISKNGLTSAYLSASQNTTKTIIPGNLGTYKLFGAFNSNTTQNTLDESTTSISVGTSGRLSGVQPGIITDSGTNAIVGGGVVELRVRGDAYVNGVETLNHTVTLISDISSIAAGDPGFRVGGDTYFVGDYVYELNVVSGTPTSYNITFNRFEATNFLGSDNIRLNSITISGIGNATGDLTVTLKKFNQNSQTSSNSWTPTTTTIFDTTGDSNISLIDGQDFHYSKRNVATSVTPFSEILYCEITTSANNLLKYINAELEYSTLL